jgi:hypothetical protein
MRLLGCQVNRASEDVRSPSALHRGRNALWQSAPTVHRTVCALTKRRLADLRLIKHRPWFALYPPEEFVSGVNGLSNIEMGALLIPSIPLI